MQPNIFLIGFSFCGKSVVGQALARRLGWRFLGTDEEVAAMTGKHIPEIFAQEGEEAFRSYERWALERALGQHNLVVATGGGAIVDPRNWRQMREHGVVICLEAQPESIYQRLKQESEASPGLVRPLLAGDNPLERIRSLKQTRQHLYAMADWTVHTDHLSIEEVVSEVLRCYPVAARRFAAAPAKGSPRATASEPAFTVTAELLSYPVYVGWGILSNLGKVMREVGLQDSALVVSDELVFSKHGATAERALRRAGFTVASMTVPAGETSKSLQTANRIYDWLIKRKAQRHHAVVALGGGMVGDLAGFVAATYLRGVPFVQVPTTNLAMVDASIGGKVAINRRQAKNLVGAFYHPRLVLSDVATLTTLSPRERAAGWAESIKHGLIMDPGLFDLMERRVRALLGVEKKVTVEVIRRSAAVKAQVVQEDPRETTGRRTILNYGHTIGHGLEAAAHYESLLHGEAIAVGMMGAALIGLEMGVTPKQVVERQRALLKKFGLPSSASNVDSARVLRAMALDKKAQGRLLRWVLLEEIGRPVLRDDVPDELVRRVLKTLTTSSPA